jgi:hypothetical protein
MRACHRVLVAVKCIQRLRNSYPCCWPSYLESLAIGLIVRIALALWGASRMLYLREQGQLFFVPHTYTGLAVSLLFLARLVYRFEQVYAATGAASMF